MAKTKAQKEEIVATTLSDLQRQHAIALVDFTGLNVQQLSALRSHIKQQEGTVRVIKRTLLQRALQDAGISLDVSNMEGELAAVFAFGDPIAPIKALNTFAKTAERLQFRGGYLAGTVLDASTMKELAELPSIEILRGQLVGLLASPMSGFANVLQGNMRGLVTVLHKRSETVNS